MIRSTYLLAGVAALLSLVASTGCNQSSSAVPPAVLAGYQTRLVLAEEPDGAITVLDVREALLGASTETHNHDHADHAEEEHSGHDHDDHSEEHAGHDHDDHADEEHAGHDHDDHADEDHAGHDHDEHADEEHAGHDHEGHDDDEHAGHDHDEEEHAGHDHEGHDDHADDEHAGLEHDAEHAHEHEHIEVAANVDPTDPIEVLMVGTIGGLTNPWEETQPDYPFTKNQASFFLADPSAVAELEASGHVHAPGEECAFCAAHAADGSAMLAMVQFLDENGKILPIGVPQMFDVKPMDTVVIQGTARIVAGGMMVVDATGIYLRR